MISLLEVIASAMDRQSIVGEISIGLDTSSDHFPDRVAATFLRVCLLWRRINSASGALGPTAACREPAAAARRSRIARGLVIGWLPRARMGHCALGSHGAQAGWGDGSTGAGARC